jgi:hypothetical protein
MTSPLSRCPAHDALGLLRQIVELLDWHPTARQYLKGVPELIELERQARLTLAPRSKSFTESEKLIRCDACFAFHVPPVVVDLGTGGF